MEFVHLHNHTMYSLLDGAIRIGDLMDRAKEWGMPALAITDHGNMFGIVEFYQAALDAGIKPIIGCEVYVAVEGMDSRRPVRGMNDGSNHLVLLAENEVGYHNLMKVVSTGFLEGFYYRPRVDKDLLRAHSEGLIALSACASGEIPHLILLGHPEKAREVAIEYRDIFGEGNFCIELQRHGLEDEEKCGPELVKIARELDIPLVATNDAHYLDREHAAAHEVLLCIQTGKTLNDENRMRFGSDEIYFRSPEEMAELFSDIPEALENTAKIAARCNLEIELGTARLPEFPLPEGFDDPNTYLEHLVEQGAKQRYPEITPEIEDRLKHELEIIEQMGFAGYFLIVADYVQYARDQGILVGLRGSGAGSAVGYVVGISDLDPLKYNLIFERFLNPERISPPDFDVDFADRDRDRVMTYVVDKYGAENVCQIIAFGSMGARGVIRDVARVLDVPLAEADKIAKLIPFELKMTLDKAMGMVPELKQMEEVGGTYGELIAYAKVLEGLARHSSVHAAGVVITPDALTNYLPIAKSGRDGVVTTQFEMDSIEKLGLLKMDFLGLSELTVIGDAAKAIREQHDPDFDIEAIPLDDPETFELLSRGDTIGVFQFSSSAMQDYLRQLRPENLDDLIAMNALYRPGPMASIPDYIRRKHGEEQVTYLHPTLEPILKDTYGVVVYQEQVMQIARDLAGYTMGGADLLRRAMSKKKADVMAEERKVFLKGCEERGIDRESAKSIFDVIEVFSGYGFNKCVTGDTTIVNAETGRRVRVLDLFSGKEEVKYVLSCTDGLKLVPRRITDVASNGTKPVYRLTTQLGRTITATSNHPFLMYDGWRTLGELNVGDQIALPRALQLNGHKTWPEHHLVVLGHLLAEGNLCHPHSFYFYTQSDEYLSDYVAHLEMFPNTKATVANHRSTHSVYARREQPREHCGAVVWLKNLGLHGKNSHTKFIPAEIFELAPRQIALFLSPLWEGDGCVDLRNRCAYYASASEEMIRGIQHLLLRFGIISRLRRVEFPYKDGRIGYTLHITGNENLARFRDSIGYHFVDDGKRAVLDEIVLPEVGSYASKDVVPLGVKQIIRSEKEQRRETWPQVRLGSGVSVKDLYRSTVSTKRGFTRRYIRSLGEYFDSPSLLKYSNSDVYWDAVASIEYVGEEETYDLTIEETHNFVADDIIVHNSHSAPYAYIAYRTAYLKAHYPREFMAANLSVEIGKTDEIVVLTDESRRMDIPVLPPDVNRSDVNFRVEGEGIRFGLGAIKNVGQGAAQSVVDAVKEDGEFDTLFDLCERVDLRALNKRALESLICAGALDTLKGHRAQFLAGLDQAIEAAQSAQKDRARGQISLFELPQASQVRGLAGKTLPYADEWKDWEKLAKEKEVLGFFMSGHPLEQYRAELERMTTHSSESLGTARSGAPVRLGGIVSEVRQNTDRNGRLMAFVTVEDLLGSVDIVVFADLYEKYRDLLQPEKVVMVKGRASRPNGNNGNGNGNGRASLRAEEFRSLEEVLQGTDGVRDAGPIDPPSTSRESSQEPRPVGAIHLALPDTPLEKSALLGLREFCTHHPGSSSLFLHMKEGEEEFVVRSRMTVAPTDALLAKLREQLGEEQVWTG